jgi:uncharacterized protein with PIN domain
VPPRILDEYPEFFWCSGCDRVHWKGSHFDSMSERVEKMLGRRP